MKTSGRYKEAFQQAHRSPAFWTEKAILGITQQIAATMKRLGLSQKAVAEKIDKKATFLSRVLSGQHNVTVETLALLAHAMDMHIEMKLVPNSAENRKAPFSVTTSQDASLPQTGVVVRKLRLVHVKEANDSITATQSMSRKAA